LGVVTLTTDFGEGSPYVAAMKAVVLETVPSAVLVDVSNAVLPFDVVSGAFVLWAGTRHFAPGAVHLAVVDPGVGGSRLPVAFTLAGSHYVGPDNGLFGLLLSEIGTPAEAVRLPRPEATSATFEGRDVFAPAAAALAAGRPLGTLGTSLSQPLRPLPVAGSVVLWVDRFGNLISNLKPPVSGVRIAGHEVRVSARTYGEAPIGQPFAYVGSMGFVEIGMREGNAAEHLEAASGTPVEPL
jgi:S-adenosylmethionine hydrolase